MNKGNFQGSPAPAKKAKIGEDEDDVGETFETKLANMKSHEGDHYGVVTRITEEGPTDQAFSDKWRRPAPPPLDPQKDSLTFQQIEIDHYTGTHLAGMPSSTDGPVPIMRMFGITWEGNSVCCHVHGFRPYFYVTAPVNFDNDHCKPFKNALNEAMKKDVRSNSDQVEDAVLAVELVKKQKLYGHSGTQKAPFLRITMALPKLIEPAKRLIEREIIYPTFHHIYRAYESDIDFAIRFMVDTSVLGCTWIELPPQCWKLRGQFDHNLQPITRCQLEVDVAWDDFMAYSPEGEWTKIAPFRILSFDIECAGRGEIFPEPGYDPVIQISNWVMRHGEPECFIRNIFTLNTCSPILGAHVISFDTEELMLQKWAEFVRELDPDIFTGYNINDFDLPYLVDRANFLKVKNIGFLGRLINVKSVVKLREQITKYKKVRKNKHVAFEGRVTFDLFPVFIHDYKLSSYKLDNVSCVFLQDKKEGVHFSMITKLQNGDAETRRRLAIYCLKDSYLAIKLIDKLKRIITYVKRARDAGVSIRALLTWDKKIIEVSQTLRRIRYDE